jgi:DNA-binding CsgD family transcriptional regulator
MTCTWSGSEDSLRSIAHAIERLTGNERVLASTASDPAINVAPLRARGALTQIRARELAFTVEETGELLLREGDRAGRRERRAARRANGGMAAGLYLAALWLRELDDPGQRVRSFISTARHVADYLTDEVLTTLAPDTGAFCCGRRCWPGSRPIFATRSLTATTRPWCSPSSRARTCSWLRKSRTGSDTPVTTCSASFCSWSSTVSMRTGCAGARRPGVEHAGSPGTRSSTRLPLATPKRWPSCSSTTTRSSSGPPDRTVSRLGPLASRRTVARVPVAAGSRSHLYGDAGPPRGRGSAAARGRGARPAGAAAAMVALPRGGRGGHPCNGDPARWRRGDRRATRRAGRPRRRRRRARGARAAGRRARPNRECGGVGPSGAELRTPTLPSRFLDGVTGTSRACAGMHGDRASRRDRARAAARRATATLAAADRGSRSCPARARPRPVARSRRERAARDLERAQRAIAEFPDPGRLPAIEANVEHDLTTARANAGARRVVEEPSAAELAVLQSLATGLSRREIGAKLYSSLNTVKTHTRELYRKLGATSRGVARAGALGLLEQTQSPG